MQRAYICKKLTLMLQSRLAGDRESLARSLVNYIQRRKISNSSIETLAKQAIIKKIEEFAKTPSRQARADIQDLIKYLQEGI